MDRVGEHRPIRVLRIADDPVLGSRGQRLTPLALQDLRHNGRQWNVAVAPMLGLIAFAVVFDIAGVDVKELPRCVHVGPCASRTGRRGRSCPG